MLSQMTILAHFASKSWVMAFDMVFIVLVYVLY